MQTSTTADYPKEGTSTENYSDPRQPEAIDASPASLLRCITLNALQAVLQESGYRVEAAADEAGRPQLRSATSGLPFFVHFGNAVEGQEAYLDFTLYAVLGIDSSVPAEVADEWNASRRFARLHRTGGFLVLQMDVSVARGHLATLVDIWDRLLNDLLRVLRDRAAPAAGR